MVALLVAFFAGPCLADTPVDPQVIRAEIRQVVDSGGWDRGQLSMGPSLSQFYAARDYAPGWVGSQGAGEQAHEILDIFRGAAEDGLCPEDYHLRELESFFVYEADSRKFHLPLDPSWMARFDIVLTDAALLYATHQIQGRVDPATVHDGWNASPRKADVAKLLQYALDGNRLTAVLADLSPPHRGYTQLKESLAGLRRLAAFGGWLPLPGGPTLRPGDTDPRVVALKRRLLMEGDLPLTAALASPVLDRDAVMALRLWQKRHGLTADGVLGAQTLAELNIPVEERIRQIELNMERWRWLPKSLGKTYILVNIADFRLSVVENDAVVLTMPVVVGTAYRKTPVFSGYMTYLEFAPYWHVPPTILREDKLPLIKADPGWMEKNHYELIPTTKEALQQLELSEIDWKEMDAKNFPGILRMKPGPWNPLGRVKFMFPNRYAVYLHDTPDRHLFARNVRSFSSGCIRIERPVDLAQFLLEGTPWDCDRILDLLDGTSPVRVKLPRAVPVHLLYFTSWVDEHGILQFRRDPYWRDMGLEWALKTAPAAERLPRS